MATATPLDSMDVIDSVSFPVSPVVLETKTKEVHGSCTTFGTIIDGTNPRKAEKGEENNHREGDN